MSNGTELCYPMFCVLNVTVSLFFIVTKQSKSPIKAPFKCIDGNSGWVGYSKVGETLLLTSEVVWLYSVFWLVEINVQLIHSGRFLSVSHRLLGQTKGWVKNDY